MKQAQNLISYIWTICRKFFTKIESLFSHKIINTNYSEQISYKETKEAMITNRNEEARDWVAYAAKSIPDEILHLVGNQ